MNKETALQILQQFATVERLRNTIDNELYDAIKFNWRDMSPKDIESAIQALTSIYPQIRSIQKIDNRLWTVDTCIDTVFVDFADSTLLVGITVPEVINFKLGIPDEFVKHHNTNIDKPFVDFKEEPQALAAFLKDADNKDASNMICCALNGGNKINIKVPSLCDIKDFAVGMQFWLDDSSMTSFESNWRLCQVTYIRQDVVFYKIVDYYDDDDCKTCKHDEHCMLANSVLLQIGRAEPVKVDLSNSEHLDARWHRPVSLSGKTIVNMKSADKIIEMPAWHANWKQA